MDQLEIVRKLHKEGKIERAKARLARVIEDTKAARDRGGRKEAWLLREYEIAIQEAESLKQELGL